MTVAHTPRRAGPYVGNGVATQFPFAFKVFAKNDVQVILANTAQLKTVLTLDSDYSVTLNQDQDNNPGGTVKLLGGPLPVNQLLIILSAAPYEQPTDIQNQSGFYPKVIEDALDRSTIQIQQLAEGLSRTIQLPVSYPHTADDFVTSLFQTEANAAASASAAAASATSAASSAISAADSAAAAATSAADASVSAQSASNAQGAIEQIIGAVPEHAWMITTDNGFGTVHQVGGFDMGGLGQPAPFVNEALPRRASASVGADTFDFAQLS